MLVGKREEEFRKSHEETCGGAARIRGPFRGATGKTEGACVVRHCRVTKGFGIGLRNGFLQATVGRKDG